MRLHARGLFALLIDAACVLWCATASADDDQPPIKTLPLPGEVFLVNDRPAFLMSSDEPREDRPWVWYAPTLPGLPGHEERWMFERFLEAGVSIAGIDVGESYGSPAGRELFTSFFEELVTQRGFSNKPAMLGRSRGGLMIYNWAVEHPKSVSCLAGIYPVCNLESWPGLGNACAAYGITADELKDKLSDHNPVSRIAPLAKAGIPIFHLHGDQDAVVPLDANSAALVEHYRQHGGKATLSIVRNGGHDMWPGWFQSRELIDFVIRNLRRHDSAAAK